MKTDFAYYWMKVYAPGISPSLIFLKNIPIFKLHLSIQVLSLIDPKAFPFKETH